MNLRIALLTLVLVGCSAKQPTIKQPCRISNHQKALQEINVFRNGEAKKNSLSSDHEIVEYQAFLMSKVEAEFNRKYELHLSAEDSPKIQNLNELRTNINKLENNLNIVKNEAQLSLDQINLDACSYEPITRIDLNNLNAGSRRLLNYLPEVHALIDKKEQVLGLISTETERQLKYRSYNGTTERLGELVIQVEDFIDDEIFLSVDNKSKNKIARLKLDKCMPYENEQGGVSCSMYSNFDLTDNHGNIYKARFISIGTTLKEVQSETSNLRGYREDLYPENKVYLRLRSQPIIPNSMLRFKLKGEFFSSQNSASFTFPTSF